MSAAETSGQKNKGKQKIEIKKITDENNLQVSFSKRRTGLFKKTSHLCTLCGPEAAVIVFSPCGKAFSFGNPSVDVVIQRYLSQAPQQASNTTPYIEGQRSANLRELNGQLSQISNEHGAYEKREGELINRSKETYAQFGLAWQVKDMDKPQLDQFKAILDKANKLVTQHGGRLSNAMVPINNPPPILFGSNNMEDSEGSAESF